ncbi:Uncharacterized protein SCF082_LOCUS23177 [Durusdinium trenchii]|uniref:Uncharacterized protein n=1 Tax=Durusdinium trenchii TaxID=1381693 RepID=A0ABP0LKW6_9DINO
MRCSWRCRLLCIVSVGLLLSISGKVLEMVRSLREERGEEDGSVSDLSSEATGSSCCFKGIRCDQADPYNIFVMQSERPDGRLKLMYAPITQSLVLGLQSREEECGYKTFKVLPETRRDIFQYPVPPKSGDVIIYVGTLNSSTFMDRCRTQMAPNRTYCIWYQVEPREWPKASPTGRSGVCEVWEYTRGNDPSLGVPLVRYVPPGFMPTEATEEQNDRLVQWRARSLNPKSLQWYFIGRLGPLRQVCWDQLQELKYFKKHELKKIPQGGAKGYPKVYTVEDWRKLGRLKNAAFLNFHQACNRPQPLETKPLETVRVAQLLSLGFLVVSEEVNSIDKALYEQIVLVEKDLFHEKNWSPFFWRLLQNKTALVDWQLRAYDLFKQRFRPSKLLHDAQVWDGGVPSRSTCDA